MYKIDDKSRTEINLDLENLDKQVILFDGRLNGSLNL